MQELAGRTLGHYRIVAEIGTGGMGVVYRAHDEWLDRDVAIKVLPDAVARDDERIARFEREARLLASLSHQNVATLHGLEEHGDRRFLVMELVEGITLSDRISGGAIPREDALGYARQIAEGLLSAHDRGVIHRDLKPANVMVCPDGRIKILDFGLAKAWRSEPSDVDLTQSPTMPAQMTGAGALIGTAAYMSPEQARGRPVDRRADIWAFGCILYEMLTHRRLTESEIDLDLLPPDLHPSVRRLLSRCLQRDPARRLRDLGDAMLELDDEDETGAVVTEPRQPRRSPLAYLGWVVATVAALVAAGLALTLQPPPDDRGFVRADIAPPNGTDFVFHSDIGSPPVISPDGSMIVFGASAPGEVVTLWVRSLHTGESRQLAGTEGGFAPFWSPNSRSIGYFDYAALRRVDLAGGPPLTVCPARIARGGAWTTDDDIIFAPDYNTGLHRVPATGGEIQPLTVPAEGRHTSHRWPVLLPDGRQVLYLAISHASPLSRDNELRLVGVDGRGDRSLVRSLANGAVVDDRLFFLRQRALLAQRIEGRDGTLSGEPVILVPEVFHDLDTWRGAFTAHGDILLYQASPRGRATQLTLFDLESREVSTVGDAGIHGDVNASPDGRHVAVSVGSPSDIWVVDLETGVGTRLTFGPASATSPIWSADGTEVFYRSYDAASPSRILAKLSSGAGEPRVVLDDAALRYQPAAASPDGRFLVLEDAFYTPGADIWVMDLSGETPPRPLIEHDGTQTQPAVSPDGRWLTYRSDETGGLRVYLEPFEPVRPAAGGPPRSGRWEIPADPTSSVVRWSSDGSSLLQMTTDRRLVAVDIEATGDSVRVGAMREICRTNAASTLRAWDVVPGTDTVVVINQAARERAPITAVIGLRRLLEEAEH